MNAGKHTIGFSTTLKITMVNYLKLIFSFFHFLDIKPEKIILVGDSAGGNLCTALTLMCIKK